MKETGPKNFHFLKKLKVVTTITTFENLKIQTLVVIVVTTYETFLKITQSCDHDHNFWKFRIMQLVVTVVTTLGNFENMTKVVTTITTFLMLKSFKSRDCGHNF